MDTRRLRRLLILVALLIPAAQAARLRIEVLRCPLAGFQYHEGAALWAELKVGDSLELVREPDNPHDGRAIAVLWRGHRLGYLPRAVNDAAARALDLGHRLDARIARLREDADPWRRMELEVFVLR